jgi:peptide deformylase
MVDIKVLTENKESWDILNAVSEEVTPAELPEIQSVIERLIEVCKITNGQGCAAPQIGINKRVFVYRMATPNPYGSDFVAVINPVVKVRKDLVTNHGEGCLSIPGERYDVKRFKSIIIEYLDRDGVKQRLKAPNKRIAFALQHEIDHLDGITINAKGKNQRQVKI